MDKLARGQGFFFSDYVDFFFHYHSTNASYSFSLTLSPFGNQGMLYRKVLPLLVSSLKDVRQSSPATGRGGPRGSG